MGNDFEGPKLIVLNAKKTEMLTLKGFTVNAKTDNQGKMPGRGTTMSKLGNGGPRGRKAGCAKRTETPDESRA